ncbi:prepilin-type N-terminal cleavage/methylation domain-containing protein [Ensifer sp. HO-A22]|uniref:Prepilin-type N-terminal cleavage/methylation domain-containing protein n=1 Tax=Ensifer oleiphilus TaxID=2742698 RepID=A0A7Y6QBM9_9HYPH|nr:GspH/FimT family pseudopilin [Ensifer oleiphilus]NVD42649.1 prepilin-type N-terminal cleavage/methylation domain-containing protein [Ensifer oleiphilus]
MVRPTSPSSNDAGYDGGFALLEILAALAIVALVAAMSFPFLTQASRAIGLKVRAAEIAALLRHGRNAAMEQGRPVQCSVDPQTRTVSSGASGRKVVLPDGTTMRVVRSGHLRSADGLGFVFLADGRALGGVLSIEGSSLTYRITVNPLTSGVTLSEVE